VSKRATLKASIETLAAHEGITPIALITRLQAKAAQMDEETFLDLLCDIKWDYISR